MHTMIKFSPFSARLITPGLKGSNGKVRRFQKAIFPPFKKLVVLPPVAVQRAQRNEKLSAQRSKGIRLF